jgi:hypothetical protein
MDAHRDPAGAGVAIVPGEGNLAALVEAAAGVQRERMGGDRHTLV